MFKRILLFAIFLTSFFQVSFSQTSSFGKLSGVWETKGNPTRWVMSFGSCFVFSNDSVGYLTTRGGLNIYQFKYTIDNCQSPIYFDYHITVPGKEDIVRKALIKLINDSTMMVKFGKDDKRPDPDMTGSHVRTYTRLKNVDAKTYVRNPLPADLFGAWNAMLKKGKPITYIFKPDGTAIYSYEDQPLVYYRYQTDFNHQPSTIDLINVANGKVTPCYFSFYADSALRLETFREGKRPSHFTALGHNIWFIKQK